MANARDRLLGKKSNLAVIAAGRTEQSDDLSDTSNSQANNSGNFAMVDINLIMPDPDQPRKIFDDEEMNQMIESVKRHGVIQPLLVRIADENKIILVAGERRLRASKVVGLKEVPVVITTGNPVEISLIENIQRVDLRPLEKAEGIQRMISEHGYLQDNVAAVLGKAKSTISEILSINRLPDIIKEEIRYAEAEKYPMRLLTSIAKHDSESEMIDIFEKYKKGALNVDGVRSISKKSKGRTNSALPNLINKRIGAFDKYIGRNVTHNNVEEVWDKLNKLYNTVQSLLALPDTMATPEENNEP